MSLRDDLCDLRARTEQLANDLAATDRALRSRNAAHLVGRAQTMVAAAGGFLTDALRQPLDEGVGHAELARSLPGRAPVEDLETAQRLLADVPETVVALSPGSARLRFRQLNNEAGNAATERLMTETGWRQNLQGYWHRPGYGAARSVLRVVGDRS